MNSLLRDLIMPDETPTGDKAVYVFIEMIALGFVLYAIEEAFKDNPSWSKVGIALVLGVLFFVTGVKWATVKSKLRFGWIRRIERIANDYRYRYGFPLVVVGIVVMYVVSSLHSLRSDIDAYITPRAISKEQSDKLRDYLAKQESSAVTIKVLPHDQEASSYAFQLFNALTQTNWEIDPPNHGGPEFFHLDPYERRPRPIDADGKGNRIYKTPDDYEDAHDKWTESEMRRKLDEVTYEIYGLIIQVDQSGQPVNPDPRHPAPDAILANALRYADIEVNGSGGSFDKGKYKVYLLVGHRPRRMGSQMSLRYRIVTWMEHHWVD